MFSPCANAADGAVGVDQRVDLREGLGEVAQDQRAHLLRPQVIGVVIAGRQHIGADQDAAPHLGAEPRRARAFVEIAQVVAVLAQAEAHAVIAREIGRGLGRRDDVIGRQARISCAAARRRRSPRRRRAATPGPAATSVSISPGMPSTRYSRGTPIRRPLTPRAQAAAKSGTGRSALVESFGSCPAIEPSRIAQSSHGARERARVIERRRERHHAPARATAIGRLHADDAAERRRLADRAAGVGAGRAHRQPRRHRGRRTAGRAAGHQHGRRRPGGASTGSPPGHRPRSCWTSPWRTRPCSSCRGRPRRRAADWR